jgi:hypothetical protein
MELWLAVPFAPAARLRELALAAEDAGLDGLAISDHVCAPASIDSPYPYSRDGVASLSVNDVLVDPVVAIASLTETTRDLRFATYVLLAALHNPVLLSRSLATLAAFAPGRVDVGVGAGWMKEDYDAVGVAFSSRGARLDAAPSTRSGPCGQPVGTRTRALLPARSGSSSAATPLPRCTGPPAWPTGGLASARPSRSSTPSGPHWRPYGTTWASATPPLSSAPVSRDVSAPSGSGPLPPSA